MLLIRPQSQPRRPLPLKHGDKRRRRNARAALSKCSGETRADIIFYIWITKQKVRSNNRQTAHVSHCGTCHHKEQSETIMLLIRLQFLLQPHALCLRCWSTHNSFISWCNYSYYSCQWIVREKQTPNTFCLVKGAWARELKTKIPKLNQIHDWCLDFSSYCIWNVHYECDISFIMKWSSREIVTNVRFLSKFSEKLTM